MKKSKPLRWSSMGEWVAAVKQASDTGIADPRLVPIEGATDPVFSDAELAALEQLADEVDL